MKYYSKDQLLRLVKGLSKHFSVLEKIIANIMFLQFMFLFSRLLLTDTFCENSEDQEMIILVFELNSLSET